eukprot:TRINITY_DN11913_c0_g1_i1.p1 TRINITY_DN11913_c0_g1~~TRINITY_DN11913_c0_g1_i1.p1  ORF type:complete len:229 (-),score=36.38 TRINITY_DN11913_c0_g1_i1:189-875(-)
MACIVSCRLATLASSACARPAVRKSTLQVLVEAPAGRLPFGARGIHKYIRFGFWGRGDDGLHSTSDTRVYKPPPARKYPYYKQRKWSRPYICKQHSPPAPLGSAVKLAISYPGFEGAAEFYKFRNGLQNALPGAQIYCDTEMSTRALKVVRVNDGRELLRLERDEVAELGDNSVVRVAELALDNSDWRYGPSDDSRRLGSDPNTTGAVEGPPSSSARRAVPLEPGPLA